MVANVNDWDREENRGEDPGRGQPCFPNSDLSSGGLPGLKIARRDLVSLFPCSFLLEPLWFPEYSTTRWELHEWIQREKLSSGFGNKYLINVVSSILLAGIDKLICDEGKSFLGLIVTRGTSLYQQEEVKPLVPKQVLSRCCTNL